MIARKLRSQGCPHIAGIAESMDEHDCRPMTAGADMNRHTFRSLNVLRAEVLWKVFNLRSNWKHERERGNTAENGSKHVATLLVNSS